MDPREQVAANRDPWPTAEENGCTPPPRPGKRKAKDLDAGGGEEEKDEASTDGAGDEGKARGRKDEATLPDFCFGGGEMGARIRSLDWENLSPLGPPSSWPRPLRSAVSILLASRFPMTLRWGKDFCEIYNDAFIPYLGKKHPVPLGRPGLETWPEVWDIICPMMEEVMRTGEAIWVPDRVLPIDKGRGIIEEIYFRWCYSPIFLEDGTPGGVFTALTETTANVIGERQLRVLAEMSTRLAEADTVKGIYDTVAEYIAEHCEYDLPFANLYALEEDGSQARLLHSVGCSGGTAVWPEVVKLEDQKSADSSTSSLGEIFKRVIWAGKREELSLARWPVEPTKVWKVKPTSCMVLPMVQKGQEKVAALLMVGLSPRRVMDDSYDQFLTLTMGQISTAITNARAREEERRRAEMLAELDRSKTLFFSNISHEFRTPLTLMLSPLETLLAKCSDDETRNQLQLVHRNALRLYKLTNTLLDFSRIEAGRVNAHYELTDVSSLTTDLVSIFRSAAERANLELLVDCPKLEGEVFVDKDMWEKVVMNLLSNALKYTLSGRIEVRLRPIRDNRWLQLSVRDTGVGIPPSELPNMFKRFHRVEHSAGRTYEGTGIGLALVSELVKLHGGTVGVQSQLNEGSTFYVEIPFGSAHLPPEHVTQSYGAGALGSNPYTRSAAWWLASVDMEEADDVPGMPQPSADPAILHPAPIQARSEATQSGDLDVVPTRKDERKAWILLVDDNSDMRKYVTRLLRHRYNVIPVTNGQEALHVINDGNTKIDLVLTDVMMPVLDGFGLLRILRSQEDDTAMLPVILLSARAGEEARVEGLEAGADAYLVKPFAACELLTVIEATLRMARMRLQAAEREQELRLEADAAKSQMEATLSSIRDAFVRVDSHLMFTYVNDNAAKLMTQQRNDLKKEDLIGRHMDDWLADTEDGLLKRLVRKAIEEGRELRFESFLASRSCWLEHRIYPGWQGGDGASILSTDITARKKVEERLGILARAGELLARAAQVEDILTSMVELPVGSVAEWCIIDTVIGTGDAHQLRRISSSNSQPWHWRLNQSDVLPSVADGDTARVNGIKNLTKTDLSDLSRLAAIQTGSTTKEVTPWGRRVNLQLANGEVNFYCSLPEDRFIALPLTARDTVFGVWLFVFPEGSSRTMPTEDIVVAKELVRRISQAIDNLRLLREAEGANQAKDHFLAALSHELRTPLTPALLAAEALRNDKRLPSDAVEMASMVQEGVELEVRLIDDLLDLTRVAKGKLQLYTRTVDVHELLNRTLRIVQPDVQAKGLRMRADFSALRRYVVGDPARLQQVFWNILKNAIKFTPSDGHVVVRTFNVPSESSAPLLRRGEPTANSNAPTEAMSSANSEGRDLRGGGLIRVEITDSGIGIESQVLPYLFRAFEQGGHAITVQFGGLGLGLAICEALVTMHQGTISASSLGRGHGATFTVDLPVLDAEEPLPLTGSTALSPSNCAVPAGFIPPHHVNQMDRMESVELHKEDDEEPKLRVLVVEDNKSTLLILSRLLRQRLGLQVFTAACIREALSVAEQEQGRFNVVISDVGLPDGTGLELVRELKARYGVPAIALTGNGMEEDIRKSMEAGFDMHLTKPIDFSALSSTIKQVALPLVSLQE